MLRAEETVFLRVEHTNCYPTSNGYPWKPAYYDIIQTEEIYLGIYVYTYTSINIIAINEKIGHKFEKEQRKL